VRQQIQRFEDMGVELLLFKLIAAIDNVRNIGGEIIAPLRSGGRQPPSPGKERATDRLKLRESVITAH
jgi:hypothetical protein